MLGETEMDDYIEDFESEMNYTQNSDFDKVIVSIDIGTTFSGSCYAYIKDDNNIIHVTKWPEQMDENDYEKTPTACLYDITETPYKLIKWGKAAVEYNNAHPDDSSVLFMDKFKLKLQNLFRSKSSQSSVDSLVYRAATVDYLRSIHTYTIEQLITDNNNANIKPEMIQYVLTVPATWIENDMSAMISIAREAGLYITDVEIQDSNILILSEAKAASLFCEREYCRVSKDTLYEGQRYLVCDAGGGTIDLATYECTGVGSAAIPVEIHQDEDEDMKESSSASDNNDSSALVEHCQLASESGGPCGSTILDLNMRNYLKDHVFVECANTQVLNALTEQFIKEIKHYFGGELVKNNYKNVEDDEADLEITKNAKQMGLDEKVKVTVTERNTYMMKVQENDHNYQGDYEEYDSTDEMHADIGVVSEDMTRYYSEDDSDQDYFDYDDDDDKEMIIVEEKTDASSSANHVNDDYIYFTLPENCAGIDPSVVESLILSGAIISNRSKTVYQLRISQKNISSHVFDPVVEQVIRLIESQIKNSLTTIHFLFVLGGFGQSPCLYKKLHAEFITGTAKIQTLIVPEHGYRASMRGGIYYGLDYLKNSMSKDCFVNINGVPITPPIKHEKFPILICIDLDLYSLQAMYSLAYLDYNGSVDPDNIKKYVENNLIRPTSLSLIEFKFNVERYISKYSLKRIQYLTSPNTNKIKDIYYKLFFVPFMQQLNAHIKATVLKKTHHKNMDKVRYSISISNKPAVYFQDNDEFTAGGSMEQLKKLPFSKFSNNPNPKFCYEDAVYKFLTELVLQDTKRCQPEYLLKSLSSSLLTENTERQQSTNNLRVCGNIVSNRNTYKTHRIILNLDEFDVDRGRSKVTCACHTYANMSMQSQWIALNVLCEGRCLPIPEQSFHEKIIFGWNKKQDEIVITAKQYTRNKQQNNNNSNGLQPDMSTFYPQEEGLVNVTTEVYRLNCYKTWDFSRLSTFPTTIKPHLEAENLLEDRTLATLEHICHYSNIMASDNVRNYIKYKVDLSKSDETHIIDNIFFNWWPSAAENIKCARKRDHARDKSTDDILKYSLILKACGHCVISTSHILNYIIKPWVTFGLVPSIIEDYYKKQLKENTLNAETSSYIVMDEIVQTKNGNFSNIYTSENASKPQTCSNYINTFFNNELELAIDALHKEAKSDERTRGVLPFTAMYGAKTLTEATNMVDKINSKSPSNHPGRNKYYIINANHARHIASFVEGAYNPPHHLKSRVAKQTYAFHFLNYNKRTAKQNNHDNNVIISDESHAAKQEEIKKAEREANEKARRNYIDLQEDALKLHPFVLRGTEIYPYDIKNETRLYPNTLDFYVRNECTVAAALYASEDKNTACAKFKGRHALTDADDFSISNGSFKKLHRFIIPIKDPEKPLSIRMKVEEYTILFHVEQDDYVADFKVYDYLFIN